MTFVLVVAFGIGIVAGLRAMTAPAAVSLAAHLRWLPLVGSPLAFMGTPIALGIFALAAIGEYVNDKLPATGSRTAPPSLIARIVMGGFSGACVCVSAGQPLVLGVLLGGIGAVIGTFGGYQVRTRLVRSLNVKDIMIAIPEDLIAIALAVFLLYRP